MSAKKSGGRDTIRVGVRVRPLNSAEKTAVWITEDSCSLRRAESLDRLCFDSVWDDSRTNKDVFGDIASDIVLKSLDGYSGCLFAYGQTGAGKTHTLLGGPEDHGLIARAAELIFDRSADQTSRSFLVQATYVEIYNERISDLLAEERTDLKLFDDPRRGPRLLGATTRNATSANDLLRVLEDGERHRSYGATAMNARSSRSHTIFALEIETVEEDGPAAESGAHDAARSVRCSTLNLIDLAGSERAAKTMAKGQRAKEGASINQSLLNLSLVIRELSKQSGKPSSPRAAFVPYRRSKLTRLLSRALGGNACSAIVCCISPAKRNVAESVGTLRFAQSAKKVVNRVTRNFIDPKDARIFTLQQEIEALRQQLQGATEDPGAEGSEGWGASESRVRRVSVERLKRGAEVAAAVAEGRPVQPDHDESLRLRLASLESSFLDRRRRRASDAKHQHVRARWRHAVHKVGNGSSDENDVGDAVKATIHLRRVSQLRRNREAMESLLDATAAAIDSGGNEDEGAHPSSGEDGTSATTTISRLEAQLSAVHGVLETQQQSMKELQRRLNETEASLAEMTAERDACALACTEWEQLMEQSVKEHVERGLGDDDGPAFTLLKGLLQEMQLRRVQRSEGLAQVQSL